MKKLIFVIGSLVAAVFANAQSANFQWAKSMGGTSQETGYSIAVDASGNIYTTGFFSGTADFDPGTGVFNLVSVGSTDVYISKLDASGNFVWAKAIGSIGDDVGRSLCVDAAGNSYTTGYFSATADFNPGLGTSNLTSAGQQDVFIIKLDASGNFVWAKKIGGTGTDRGYGIALDASGNILTTGYFYSTADFDPGTGVLNIVSAGQSDIFVLKLNSSGNFMWAKTMGGINTEVASSIAVDASENVYTTGSLQDGTAADFDPGTGVFNLTSSLPGVFISKLDASGNFVWATAMAEAGGAGTSIFIDVYSNVFTTGYFSATTDFAPGPGVVNLTPTGFYDVFVSKLSSSGYYIWAKNMGGIGADFGQAVTADAFGNVYTTGEFQGGTNADFDPGTGVSNFTTAGGGEIFVSKLDFSGNFVWAKAMSGSNYEDGKGIVIDGSTNVYITGRYAQTVDFNPGTAVSNLTSAGVNDAFVHKMSQNSPGSPVASFTTILTAPCVGNPLLFLNASTGNPTSWNWDFGDGTTSILENPVHFFTSSGIYTVILTATSSFGSDTASATFFVRQVDVSVSASGSTLTAANSNGTYQWIDCNNGNSVLPNQTNQSYTATITGNYAVIISENGCVGTSVCTTVNGGSPCAPAQPGSISGKTSVNAGTAETYSVIPVAGATSYNWTFPSGWFGGSTTNSITLLTGSGSGVITVSAVNNCGSSAPTPLFVNVNSGSGSSTKQTIAGGVGFGFKICSDSTLRAWGYNGYGQLGNAKTSNSNVPVQVSFLTNIISIAAGDDFSLALKSDGTLWAWGRNHYGQLGIGNTSQSNIPMQVSGLTGIIAIAAGEDHSLALKNDGTVWAWGYNWQGQLGNGTNIDSYVPVQVSSLNGITAIAAGKWFSIALKNDGTVHSWGDNLSYQLGNGFSDSNVPVQVSSLSGITAITSGMRHSLALKNDGTVHAWGLNYQGQLGNGTITNANVPVQVSNLSGITSISAGYRHSHAIKNDGTTWAWGENGFGELGNGTSSSNVLTAVSSFTSVIAIAAGKGEHTYALKANGTLWACGYNSTGQLGNGTNTNSNVPVQVIGLCNNSTGLEDNFKNNLIRIYPNPSNGILNIELNDLIKTELKVYNTLGQEVFTKSINEKKSIIDLYNLIDGVYYLRFKNDNGVTINKIIFKK